MHASFMPLPDAPSFAAISRYADPEADGVVPIFRTSLSCQNQAFSDITSDAKLTDAPNVVDAAGPRGVFDFLIVFIHWRYCCATRSIDTPSIGHVG